MKSLLAFVLGYGLLIYCNSFGFAQPLGASPQPAIANPSAQVSTATSAAPAGMPVDVQAQTGSSGASSTAPEAPIGNVQSVTGSNFIYDTLRVITKGAPRGCGNSDWNCMSNLCKQDLGQTSWRGWGGCHAHDNDFICYFECSQTRQTF